MDLIPLSTIRPDTLHWLWPGWLPQGKLTILDGDPGTGKSLITLDICARLTRGLPFPDAGPLAPVLGGEGQGEGALISRSTPHAPRSPHSVIILSAEDAIADTVLPRLLRFGADMSRVFTLGTEGVPALGAVSLAAHIESLEHALEKCHARLVIIDPLMAFLDRSIASASDSSVRSVLTPLARLAQDYSCAILMVRHLAKKGRHALYRGGGSIGILGACRSAWLTGRDPTDPSRFILAQTKNNLGAQLPAIAYTLSPRDREDTLAARAEGNVVARVSGPCHTDDNDAPRTEATDSPLAPVLGREGQGEGAFAPLSLWERGGGEGALPTTPPTAEKVVTRFYRPCPSDPLGVLGGEGRPDEVTDGAHSAPLAPVLGGEGQGEGVCTPPAPRPPLHAPLLWLGPREIHPNDILAPSPPPRPRVRIRQVLKILLGDGPLPYPEILRRAPECKHHTTLFRAKNELNIQSIRIRQQGGTTVSYWLLPGQTLPPEIRTEDIICDPDDILGPEKRDP